MKKPVLVIMAAGMGSRYGGLKQMDPVNKDHLLIEYAVYDAIRAGFEEVVFIINKKIEQDFKELIGKKLDHHIKVQYAIQDISDIPADYTIKNRMKPWGTAHAIYAARNIIDSPFAVINADDYYGISAFKSMYEFLSNIKPYHFSMIGYSLKNTVTDNGSVSRGVCTIKDNILTDIVERTKIIKKDQKIYFEEEDLVELNPESVVSMNFWGFGKEILDDIKELLDQFLSEYKDEENNKKEFFLPMVVDDIIRKKKGSVQVILSKDKWHGMTYKEDKKELTKALLEYTSKNIYPEKLW